MTSPFSHMETIPLTPAGVPNSTNDSSERRRKQQLQQQQQQSSNSGWASSMALFTGGPPATLSESSSSNRRTNNNRTTSSNSYSCLDDVTVPSNVVYSAVYPASSISHDEGDTVVGVGRVQQQYNGHDDDDETQGSSPRLAQPRLVNPWIIPHVQSHAEESIQPPLSTTSSNASSAFGNHSYFGFGRRASIRSELDAQGSVSSFQHHLDGEEYISDQEVSLHTTRDGVEVSDLVHAPPRQHDHNDDDDDLYDLESPYSNSTDEMEQSYLSGLWHTVSSNIHRLGHNVSWLRPSLGTLANNNSASATRNDWNSNGPAESAETPIEALQDLQKTHREKISELQQTEDDNEEEDMYDFCLVLTQLQVYAFWAELLDFRAEALILQSAGSDDTHEETDEEEALDDPTVPIDARPFMTPQTGMRRRRQQSPGTGDTVTTNHHPSSALQQQRRPMSMAPISEQKSAATGMYTEATTTTVGGTRTRKQRLSMFEKAVVGSAYGTPASRMSMMTTDTPSILGSRRRWGNRHDMGHTPDLPMSPHSKRLARKKNSSHRTTTTTTADDEVDEALDKGTDSLDNIPSQVVPRGIAARTNGMMQFLSALKRGIVVRRHRPSHEAMFYKLFSLDGGDTIKLEPLLNTQEAMLALREQRLRYNKKAPELVPAWSEVQQYHTKEQNFQVPDFIAAEQYRRRQVEREKGLKKSVMDVAAKIKKQSTVRTADVIAVHPARHEDPRYRGELGTSTLRRSKSEYDSQHSFSIVTRANRHIQANKLNRNMASEKWHSGEGGDAQFKHVDLEAATEGEYWLVFRGFLLLHRDAATGRFASNRAAGFGSHSNRRDDDDADAEAYNRLQSDAFHEPRIVSWFEQFVAKKIRKIDLTVSLYGAATAGATPPPSDYFLGFRSPGTQIWSRLRQAGLETLRIHSIDPRRVMIKIRCPVDRLTDVAEVLRIKVRTRGGKYAPFRENAVHQYQPLNDELDAPESVFEGASLFRSSERQQVIDFVIRSRIRESGAELGRNTELGKMIQARVPLHMHKKRDSVYNAWFFFWKRENWTNRDGRSMVVGFNNSTRLKLESRSKEGLPIPEERLPPNAISRFVIGAFFQPLDSIEQYFGEKVTFYFAWLQHASYHLIFLSLFGFFVFLCQISSGKWDHPIRPYFSVVIMLWSFVVLVNWRKRQSFLAHRWGTMDHKVQETTRPQFKGEYKRDPITGEWIVYYPAWKRYLKYLISFPVTLAFTLGTLIVILLVHANRDQMLARYFEQIESPGSEEFRIEFRISAIGEPKSFKAVEINKETLQDPKFWFLIGGLPSLLGLCLPLLNFILMRISVMLTDFENYRTESHYRSALIIKVFSFRFVCYFATLYYYCFLSVVSNAIEEGILRVATGVFIYTTVAHYWGIFLSMYFPLLIYHIRRRRQKKRLHEELMQVEKAESELEDLDPNQTSMEEIEARKIRLVNKRLLLDQAQDELWKEVMLPQHDSFPEYIQGVVQFAYVTCFSVVLPLTPIICLVNHLISMRLDAYKLCKTRQRPLALKTGGIGVWEHVLHVVTVIAVLTNCSLMGFTTSQFAAIAENINMKGEEGSKNGEIALFAIIVGWEHIMLLIKYVMQTSISKLPLSVRNEMKKEFFENERKRNSSMRHKKDRRLSGRALFGSPIGETPQSTKSTRFNLPALTTIPSEDQSENGTPSTPNSTKKMIFKRNDESRIPMTSLGTNRTPRVSSLTKQSVTSESQGMQIPTPLHLGGALAAEAKAAEEEALLGPGSPFSVYASHSASQSRLGTSTISLLSPDSEDSDNVSDLLGHGIEDSASLATKENDESLATRVKEQAEIDDANTTAAARINARLGLLEQQVATRMTHSRHTNNDDAGDAFSEGGNNGLYEA